MSLEFGETLDEVGGSLHHTTIKKYDYLEDLERGVVARAQRDGELADLLRQLVAQHLGGRLALGRDEHAPSQR